MTGAQKLGEEIGHHAWWWGDWKESAPSLGLSAIINVDTVYMSLIVALILVLLFLLPSFYFGLIFWPALTQGKVYGNLLYQKNLAIELNHFHRDSELSDALPIGRDRGVREGRDD